MADSEEINPTVGADGLYEWEIAGYSDLFSGEYSDFEKHPSAGNDWYPDADLVTISWTDADSGEKQYARLEGPFEDYDDLYDAVESYFENGTP